MTALPPSTRSGDSTAAEAAALSAGALDRALSADAELSLLRVTTPAYLVGAFDRATACDAPVHRRGSGGPVVRVGEGTLWVQLALARASALVPCTPDKLVNRYVRPLLRAITKRAAIAHWFGRDWISVGKRPAAWIGFSHDGRSGRAMVEAIVAVRTRFEAGARASFQGKEPATLEEIAGRAIDLDALAEAIAQEYGLAPSAIAIAPQAPLAPEAPWGACADEAIGRVCVGRDAAGKMRVGGELMASRDAIAALEEAIASLPNDADAETIGAAVDAAFGAPGVVVEGVRALASVRDAIARAMASE